MLDDRGAVLRLHHRERVGLALLADQHRVALRMVPAVLRVRQDLHQAAIRVVGLARGNSLRHDRASRVVADVDHLRAGIGLHPVVRQRDGVKLADRIFALEDAARILPRDRRARLDLRPRNLGILSPAMAALRHEVVDAALPVLVARVPVLDRGVLDLSVFQRDQLDDRRVELVLVPHRRRAAFEVGNVRALVRDDQRPLELAGLSRVDPEVGRQLDGTANAFRDVTERTVREDGGVQGGKKIIRVRDDRADIFPHQVRMLAHGFRERAENDAEVLQHFLVRGRDGHAVEHGIHGHAFQPVSFVQAECQASQKSSPASRPPRPARRSAPAARRSNGCPGNRSADT